MFRKGVFIALLGLSVMATEAHAKGPEAGIQLLEELQNIFIGLAEKVKPSVVNIAPVSDSPSAPRQGDGPHPRGGPNDPPSGSGSGVIIGKEGFILTNNHVVGDAESVEIRLSDKTKFTGKVVGKDPDTDLALVKIEAGRELPVVPFGDSSKIKVGQWAIAVGNPFGLDRTLTIGVISALGRENVNLSRYEDFIQTDASINPGNSGGPLFNIRGEVIGINTAIINFAQGIGFAIPSNMAQSVMTQLMEKGKVTRGWLGVGIQLLTEALARPFGVKEGEGVLVNEVFAEDPAGKAGILPGDIILSVGGAPVDNPSTLARLVAGFFPGETVNVEVLRNGKKNLFPVVLTEREGEVETTSLKGGVLGLTVQETTPELLERFKIRKEEKGVLIGAVEPGSAAESEGLKEGDLIKEVNREEVPTPKAFGEALEKARAQETILLRVVRENRAFFVVLKPAKSDQ
jgi:serine protease Do